VNVYGFLIRRFRKQERFIWIKFRSNGLGMEVGSYISIIGTDWIIEIPDTPPDTPDITPDTPDTSRVITSFVRSKVFVYKSFVRLWCQPMTMPQPGNIERWNKIFVAKACIVIGEGYQRKPNFSVLTWRLGRY
jgi:hypothetical protein